MVRRNVLRACSALAAVCAAFAFELAATVPANASSVCTSGSSAGEARTLGSALSSASNAIGDTHGVAVYDLTTGVGCAVDANDQMITASIVKASILAALLVQHQDAGTALTGTERAEATEMIENSNNDAATDLYEDIGKVSGLQAFFAKAGMTRSEADSAWGLTETTAADQVKLLKLLLGDGSLLSSASRGYELGLMREVESDQRWGTPYDAPGGVTVAVKNGWLYQDSGAWHINSLGAFTGGSHTYVMAVTSEDNSSESGGISEVETLAKAVNTRILATSTKPAAVKATATATKKAATHTASPSPSPSKSASASASASAVAEALPVVTPSPPATTAAPSPLATAAVASTADPHTRAAATMTLLVGVTAPGSLLFLTVRRRRLFAAEPPGGPGAE
jgi:beta-lactamase class A